MDPVPFGFTGPDDPQRRLRDPALGGGALAVLTCSIVCETPRSAVICGTDGMIQLSHFYAASGFDLWRDQRLAEQVSVPYPGHGLAPQAAEVMRWRREGRTESPLVPLSATLAVLRTPDEVRNQVGVCYPQLLGPSVARL